MDTLTHFVRVNGNYVKSTNTLRPARVFCQVPGCRTRDSVLLVNRNRLRTTAMVIVLAVFYLDKNQGLVIFHNQVNFTKAAVEISL